MPRDALKTSASNPGVISVSQLQLSAAARAISSCGSEISAGVILLIDVGGGVTQHALRADVENLDHALLVGGDAGEIGAVEDRVLQGAGLEGCRRALGNRHVPPVDALMART